MSSLATHRGVTPTPEDLSAAAKVPFPYEPVKASTTEFECLGRKHILGDMLLPVSITAANGELLSAPVRLASGPASLLDGITGQSHVVENTGDSARWDWQGENAGFTIHSRMTGDCDGFCWYEITLTPRQPVEVTSLRLEIPRLAETSRLEHTARFVWAGQTSGSVDESVGGKKAFAPYVWLGDEEKGLAWCCESSQGWDLDDPDSALEIEPAGDTVFFIANIIDHPKVIDSPIVLKFGLQATPVKPVTFGWRAKARMFHGVTYASCEPDADGKIALDILRDAGVKTVAYHQFWPGWYGGVTPEGDLHRLIDECHKRGMKLIVYIGYGLARMGADLKGHYEDWSIMPLIPFDIGIEELKERNDFDATCSRSGWSDWLVQGIDKLFSEYKLDGLYFDGTSESMQCENERHGCGWRDDKGQLHPTYPLLTTRSLMRRIADTVHRYCKDAILDVHMSASLTMPTLSFCDSYLDGEQYQNYTSADNFEIPLDTFRAEFMGWAHGLDAQFLCYDGHPWANMNEAIALAGLHGVEVRPWGVVDDLIHYLCPLWNALDRFGYTEAEWVPYWKDTGISSSDDLVKTSAYLKEGAALLFISHLNRGSVAAAISLDRGKLGLGGGNLFARNALTGEQIALNDDEMSLNFDGMTYHLVEIHGGL